MAGQLKRTFESFIGAEPSGSWHSPASEGTSAHPVIRKVSWNSASGSALTYLSKDRKEKKTYDAPEWLAAMRSHVPERGQQSVRYHGAYANSTRGRERKREADDGVPTVLEPDFCSREIKRNGSRLIRKVYETDPMLCPPCEHPMRVIASTENPTVIRRILEHLGLRLANARSEPRAHSPPVHPVPSDAFFSQLPAWEEDDFSQAPPAPWEC